MRTSFVLGLAVAAGLTAYPASVVGAQGRNSCRNGFVGLSFDDGPFATTRAALLDVLTAAHARATFFEIGLRARQNPELVRATLRTGMWIGNHTLTHPHLPQIDSTAAFAEIASTQFVLQQITGRFPELFRPPYGETSEGIRRDLTGAKLLEVLWTVDSRDWAGASATEIRAAAGALQPGGIILMHDGIQPSLDALPRIISDLSSRGLCTGRISYTARDISGVGTVFHAIAVKP